MKKKKKKRFSARQQESEAQAGRPTTVSRASPRPAQPNQSTTASHSATITMTHPKILKVSAHLHSTTNQKKDALVFMSNGLANCREQATVFVCYVLISIFYLLSIGEGTLDESLSQMDAAAPCR